MSQLKVTSYYSTRKRVHESKLAKQETKTEIVGDVDKLKVLENLGTCDKAADPGEKITTDNGTKVFEPASEIQELKIKDAKKKTGAKSGKSKSKGATKTKPGNSTRKREVTDKGKGDIRTIFQSLKVKSVALDQKDEKCISVIKEETDDVAETCLPRMGKAKKGTFKESSTVDNKSGISLVSRKLKEDSIAHSELDEKFTPAALERKTDPIEAGLSRKIKSKNARKKLSGMNEANYHITAISETSKSCVSHGKADKTSTTVMEEKTSNTMKPNNFGKGESERTIKGSVALGDGIGCPRVVSEVAKEKYVALEEDADCLPIIFEEIQESLDASSSSDNVTGLGSNEDIKSKNAASSEQTVPTTPKRTLSNPEKSPCSSKKKKTVAHHHVGDVTSVPSSISPQKKLKIMSGASCRHLDFSTALPTQSNPKKQSLEVIATNAERSKLLNSGRLDTLKERLVKFNKSLAIQKDLESNKFKITSVISPGRIISDGSQETPESAEISRRASPCYEKFHSLAVPGTPLLLLPYKYRILSETFRCCDTVVSILHNRKEICTFEKLKSSAQNMMKKNFTRSHLSQIKTVFPQAYYYTQEKLPSRINLKPGASQFQLVITPNLRTYKEQSNEDSGLSIRLGIQSSGVYRHNTNKMKDNSSSQEEISSNVSIQMDPNLLVERREIFCSNLLKIVKQYHLDFLARLNPPISLSPESVRRWHPKFPLDSVPDVQPSQLPEPDDVQKCHTAMDVLNKIKGTVCEKVEKALQSTADKNMPSDVSNTSTKLDLKGVVKTGVLKGICNDLLQKIRAREASKIVLEMTRPPEETKRMEMMERIPEMVRILRNFFVAARKAAVSLEDATEKIRDSYCSALPAESVKVHLQLMAEVFPKWLTVITIRKGVFLKIDKNMDINIMLDSITKK